MPFSSMKQATLELVQTHAKHNLLTVNHYPPEIPGVYTINSSFTNYFDNT
jgi:hypothetical protein